MRGAKSNALFSRRAGKGTFEEVKRSARVGVETRYTNPPLFLDLPTKDGVPQPDVIAKWTANAPLAFVYQYIGNLRSYRGIGIDVGDQDGLRVDTGKLHDALDKYGITNGFDVYAGTHTSTVADRFQNDVMPFFSQNLFFQASCQ